MDLAHLHLDLSLGPDIPVVCVANKIDVEPGMAKKKFNFPVTHQLPFFLPLGNKLRNASPIGGWHWQLEVLPGKFLGYCSVYEL